jgi:hypothetical protein
VLAGNVPLKISDAPGEEPTERLYCDTPRPFVQEKGAPPVSRVGIADPLTGQVIVAGAVALGGFTVRPNCTDWLVDPPVAATAKEGYVVVDTTGGAVTVITTAPLPLTVDGEKATVEPLGSPLGENVTRPPNPFTPVTFSW